MGDIESQPQRISIGAFVGRERELSELCAGLDDALEARGRLFLISGEPGIGKTRLSEEISKDALMRGMRVVWGRCWEGGGAPAYWPFIQVLRALVEGVRRSDLVAKLGPHAPEIARIHPELYPEPAAESRSAHLDPEQARFRLFDAVATLVGNSTREQPLLMIVDDLHDADEPSVQMLTFVARALKDERILIIGTYRDFEVRRSRGLEHLVGELRREGIEISLSGLDEKSVASLIQQRLGAPPIEGMAADLHSATAGNPLFVDAVVRVLASEGKLVGRYHLDLAEFNVPDGVRQSLRRRIAMLPTEAKRVLEVAAALGNEFDLTPIGRVLGMAAEQVVEVLVAAAELGLVKRLASLRFRFHHALIRATLYDEIPAVDRIHLHRVIGESLEATYRNTPDTHLAELAFHFRLAAQSGDADKAIEYSIRAGDVARSVFLAHEEALSYWSAALELIEEFGGHRRDYAALHQRLGNLISTRGERAKAIEHLERALRSYEEVGDERRAAETHLMLGNHFALPGLSHRHDIPRAAEHLRRAEVVLSKGPEDSTSAMLYYHIGRVAMVRSRVLEATAAHRRSMEIAERIGDADVWARSAGTLASVLLQTGKIAEALNLQAQVWLRLDTFASSGGAFATAWSGGHCSMQLWDPRAAQSWWAPELAKPRLGSWQRKVFLQTLEDAYLLAGDIPAARSLLVQAPHASAAALLAFYEGEWERADSILEQGLEHARSVITPSGSLAYEQVLARVRWIRGEPARAETLLQQALAPYPDDEPHCQAEMVVRPELALVYLEMGKPEDAVAQVSRCREVSADEDWRGLGGHLARAEAAVAAAARKSDEAEAGFESAVRTFRKFTLPWEEAETLQRWGRILLKAGDRVRAIEKFDAAIELYRSRGSGARWVERVEIDRRRAASADTAEAPADSSLVAHRNGAGATEAASAAPAAAYDFRREAEYWTISYEGRSFRLKDSKGLAYIAHLLRHTAVEFHVIELVSVIGGGERIETPASRDQMWDLKMTPGLGDAGAMLDPAAKAAYKRRLDELREELAEAREFNDPGRVEKAEKEIEFLTRELARAVGLSGRDRKAASHAERSRVKVTKAIRVALRHIAKASPGLGRHLEATIKTGQFCVYIPDPGAPLPWRS